MIAFHRVRFHYPNDHYVELIITTDGDDYLENVKLINAFVCGVNATGEYRSSIMETSGTGPQSILNVYSFRASNEIGQHLRKFA